MILTREQVYNAALIYFKNDELAANVFTDKYALKVGNKGYVEATPLDMQQRVINEIHRIENKYDKPLSKQEIEDMILDFAQFTFGGSVLAGAGNNNAVTSLSNCFVVDAPKDSYGSILKSDEEQTQLMKRRGGVGKDLSKIRPTGAMANGTVLGPDAGMTLFMHRYSNSTREVAQDGRRGALMLSVDIMHPDAEKFATMKQDLTQVTGANISVKTNKMFTNIVEAAKADPSVNDDFIQRFPIDLDLGTINPDLIIEAKQNKGLLVDAGDGRYIKCVSAVALWDVLMKCAHATAEPGILYWDTIIEESPAEGYAETQSTNPCNL